MNISRRFRPNLLSYFLLLLSFISVHDAYAQKHNSGIERGLYASFLLGSTDLNDDRLSGMVQPFIRHRISDYLSGEFSVGLGILNSSEYQTRIMPIEYQFLIHPFKNDLFLYAGAGLLNYSQVRILRPDDPLTADAGKTISNSSFWSFKDHWTYSIPVGVGTSFSLDDRTRFSIKAGYTLTGTDELEALALNNDGYWSVSVGLSFRGRSKTVRAPDVIDVMAATAETAAEVVTETVVAETEAEEEIKEIKAEEPISTPEEPVRLPDVELPAMINFEVLTAELDESEIRTLDRVFNYLERYEDRGLLINGHTDLTGANALNYLLSGQRAWSAKKWLVSKGIASERVVITAKGYAEPIADNSTETGRRTNRRVEFESVNQANLQDYRSDIMERSAWPQPIEISLPEPGGTIHMDPFLYDVTSAEIGEEHLLQLVSLHNLLMRETALEIDIIGHSDGLPSEDVNLLVSSARANGVAEFLINHGVEPKRVVTHSIHSYDNPIDQFEGRILIMRRTSE